MDRLQPANYCNPIFSGTANAGLPAVLLFIVRRWRGSPEVEDFVDIASQSTWRKMLALAL